MASVKIASLLLKTLSKPIAARLKRGAKEHEKFREMSVSFGQFLHRSEMTVGLLLLLLRDALLGSFESRVAALERIDPR